MPHVSRVVKAIGGSWLSRGIGMEDDGVTGGLISLWNEDQFTVKVCIINKQYVVLISELTVVRNDVAFCNIYASNFENERKELWSSITNAQKSFLIPWCIGGDFNSVLNPSERVGVGCNMSLVKNFNAFVLEAKVVDLPLQRSPFT